MYKVTLIKNMTPYKKGDILGGVDLEVYKNLCNKGFINDEYNLLQEKKENKKTKKD